MELLVKGRMLWMFGLKVSPQQSLKSVCGNQGPLMDLTLISMWYVIKHVTERLQPAKIKIFIRVPTATDFFRVLLSVLGIFYNHTKYS